MQWWRKAEKLLQYQPPTDTTFILSEGSLAEEMERTETSSQHAESTETATQQPPSSPPHRQLRKPVPVREKHVATTGGISPDLAANKAWIEQQFHTNLNKDVSIREFSVDGVPGFLVYIDGIADSSRIMYAILQPLMVLSRRPDTDSAEPATVTLDDITAVLLPAHQLQAVDKLDDVRRAVLNGQSALFIAGETKALAIETRSFPYRGVNTPLVEAIVRGPQEAFTESMRVNIGLIRKYTRNPNLVTEQIDIGENVNAALLYMHDVANPSLVTEVKRRLSGLRGEILRDTGIVEQMIEDHPGSIYPQSLATERPDRVAAMLQDGKLAIVLDGNPFTLVVPATLFSMMKTPEDTYLRPAFGTFMRLVRVAAIFIAYLLPGLYLAILNHHHALLPTDLLLAIAGAREGVPFPSWLEVLAMETLFEVIREASIRVPGAIGPTLGIVSAIVLGQAAVQAAIVSPILIIVVSITALASFAIPNYALQFSTRIIRFGYIALGYGLGIFGLAIGLSFQLLYAASLTSFGIGFLAPVAPTSKHDVETVLRSPVYQQEARADFLQVRRRIAQPKISRKWAEEGEPDEET